MSKQERREFLKAALATLATIPAVGCIPMAMCYAVVMPVSPSDLLPDKHADEQPQDHPNGNPDEEPQKETD